MNTYIISGYNNGLIAMVTVQTGHMRHHCACGLVFNRYIKSGRSEHRDDMAARLRMCRRMGRTITRVGN